MPNGAKPAKGISVFPAPFNLLFPTFGIMPDQRGSFLQKAGETAIIDRIFVLGTLFACERK
jgi:hypothetical protein